MCTVRNANWSSWIGAFVFRFSAALAPVNPHCSHATTTTPNHTARCSGPLPQCSSGPTRQPGSQSVYPPISVLQKVQSPNPASPGQPATGTDGSMMAHHEFWHGEQNERAGARAAARAGAPTSRSRSRQIQTQPQIGSTIWPSHPQFRCNMASKAGSSSAYPTDSFDTLGLVNLCEHDQHHSPVIYFVSPPQQRRVWISYQLDGNALDV